MHSVLSYLHFSRSRFQLKAMSCLLFMAIFCLSVVVNAQTNVALTATASHSGGGSTIYAASNYNDGIIAASSSCSSSATPWGWVTGGGSITYTWGAPVTCAQQAWLLAWWGRWQQ